MSKTSYFILLFCMGLWLSISHLTPVTAQDVQPDIQVEHINISSTDVYNNSLKPTGVQARMGNHVSGTVILHWSHGTTGSARQTEPALNNVFPENEAGKTTPTPQLQSVDQVEDLSAAVLYYELFRNGQKVGRTAEHTFTDQLEAFGTYTYEIKAVYEGGETKSAEAVEVQWVLLDDELNILVLEELFFADNQPLHYDDALQELGLARTFTWNWTEFTEELNSQDWDLIIVNSYSNFSPASVRQTLNEYISNDEGKLIFASWDVFQYPTDPLLSSLGIEYIEDIYVPKNMACQECTHPVFMEPNSVNGFYWTDNQYYRDGQIVEVLDGATRLATFPDVPGSAAMVRNAQRNAIYNAFQASNYNSDHNGNEQPDIRELIENQITLLITEHSYSTSLPGPDSGWQILAAPTMGATYEGLLNTIWTQGYEGSSSSSQAASNVFWFRESDASWQVPQAASNILGSGSNSGTESSGKGIIVYVFDSEEPGGPAVWPKEIGIKGEPPYVSVELALSRTAGVGAELAGWHVLGNPYPYAISWPQLVAANDHAGMKETIFIYDKNANVDGDYLFNPGFEIEGPAEEAYFNGIIAPFQGFKAVVQNDTEQGMLTFRPSHSAEDAGLLEVPLSTTPYFALTVSGSGLHNMAVLTFKDTDEYSVDRPQPLNLTPLSFGITPSEESGGLIALQNLNLQAGQTRSIGLSFGSTVAGSFTLDLHGLGSWLEEVEVVLVDHYTGQEQILGKEQGYSFTNEPTEENMQRQQQAAAYTAQALLSKPELLSLQANSRFELLISTGSATSTGPGTDLPAEYGLKQNYPNPFNPTTRIEYALPEAADVRLEIFNMLGQQVAVLHNGPQRAGYHSASFDAQGLSSGIYIYRLQAGSFIQSQKMTLIK